MDNSELGIIGQRLRNKRLSQPPQAKQRVPPYPYVLLAHLLYTYSSWVKELENGYFKVEIQRAAEVTKIRRDYLMKAFSYLHNLGFIQDLQHPTHSGILLFRLKPPVRGCTDRQTGENANE